MRKTGYLATTGLGVAGVAVLDAWLYPFRGWDWVVLGVLNSVLLACGLWLLVGWTRGGKGEENGTAGSVQDFRSGLERLEKYLNAPDSEKS